MKFPALKALPFTKAEPGNKPKVGLSYSIPVLIFLCLWASGNSQFMVPYMGCKQDYLEIFHLGFFDFCVLEKAAAKDLSI